MATCHRITTKLRGLTMEHFSESSHLPEPEIIKSTLPSVIQVVALRKGFMGGMSVIWTGSGTIVDSSGIILTNCHVANPRAMGMPGPQADRLAISITQRSDEPPALTYLAEVVVQSPQLDLAVLKITHGLNGKPVGSLNLPALPIGDSDELELGNTIAILGYPGIGGETVTFTSGSVAGFTREEGIDTRRGWIKTDATIAGGNSGGTAVNHSGKLIGIPTQASAGSGVTPVDARPVIDTNQDGRIDHQDTPMAIGGFINGLRPVNLAKPLLRKAGVDVSGSHIEIPTTPPQPPASSPKKHDRAVFSNLVFSSRVTGDGRPINPATILPVGIRQIFATVDFAGMEKGTNWGQTWALNGKPIFTDEGQWGDATRGGKVLVLSGQGGLPEGEYRLVVTVEREVVMEGAVTVGRRVDDTDTEISGQIIDQRTHQGISDALVIALKPGMRVMDFIRHQSKNMTFTSTRTDSKGQFVFPNQLPKGQAYGLIVVARGYRDLAVESALRVSDMAPEQARIYPIPLQPE
jgi:S1-C subfamily serine protease